MAKKSDVRDAVSESKNEFHCIMFPEQYHAWSVVKPWDAAPLRKHKIKIVSVEVKASRPTGESEVSEIDKNRPLRLKCGLEILNGRVALTPQSQTARLVLRVDDVNEFNEAMNELSLKYVHQNWEVSKLEVYNQDAGASLYFHVHSPNGLETRLFLWRVETSDYSKSYELINIFEQQRLCNNFYEYFAQCSISERVVKAHSCALEKRRAKAKTTRSSQSTWKKKKAA